MTKRRVTSPARHINEVFKKAIRKELGLKIQNEAPNNALTLDAGQERPVVAYGAKHVVNHEEALQLAHIKKAESNLARCYIGLYASEAAKVVQLQERVDQLLLDNNRYLEDARAARRQLLESQTAQQAQARSLLILKEALRYYEEGRQPVDAPLGYVAQQALARVFGELP